MQLVISDAHTGLRSVIAAVLLGASWRRLGEGRQEVTGFFTIRPQGAAGTFVCVVAPDASDELRGLRVERLQVQELAGQRTGL